MTMVTTKGRRRLGLVAVLLILAAGIAFLVLGLSMIAHAGTLDRHYSRPYSVQINTRANGHWNARCHGYREGINVWTFTGCLPPSHHRAATAKSADLTAARVVPAFTASGRSGSCRWAGRGRVERDKYIYIRLRTDTCGKYGFRMRAAGVCTYGGIGRFRAGNWIWDWPQLTSVRCPAGQLFTVDGYDRQYRWGRHFHHRGKVVFVPVG